MIENHHKDRAKVEIETKVTSTQIIKPSSPIPKSLHNHQLCFIDQASAPFFSNHIYFYSSNPEIPNSDKTNHLKKSLSETLTPFYPLAGRLIDNRQVDCSDGGIPFSEAEANCQLSQAIHKPNAKQLYKFIPREPKDICMAIQTTYFRCGGVAVAISITHKLADAASFFSFASSWSAFARNDTPPPPPLFNAAYFPPMYIPGVNIKTVNPVNEDVAARIFTLPPSKIALLRETYAAAAGHRPTRMEAVSAFIWTRFISTMAIKPNRNNVYTVRHTVNLRGRVDDLALPDNLFGNIMGVSTANVTAEDGGGELVMKFRRAIKAAMGSGGVVAELRESDKQMNLMKKVRAEASNGEPVTFSNLCGFSVYETDFGWGKPVWVASPGFLYNNTVVFNDAKSGGGMEVLITLNKEDMENLKLI